MHFELMGLTNLKEPIRAGRLPGYIHVDRGQVRKIYRLCYDRTRSFSIIRSNSFKPIATSTLFDHWHRLFPLRKLEFAVFGFGCRTGSKDAPNRADSNAFFACKFAIHIDKLIANVSDFAGDRLAILQFDDKAGLFFRLTCFLPRTRLNYAVNKVPRYDQVRNKCRASPH